MENHQKKGMLVQFEPTSKLKYFKKFKQIIFNGLEISIIQKINILKSLGINKCKFNTKINEKKLHTKKMILMSQNY